MEIWMSRLAGSFLPNNQPHMYSYPKILVIRPQFALLTPQVLHFWAFLQLQWKPLWMTALKWQRLWMQRCHLPLRSIQDLAPGIFQTFLVTKNVAVLQLWQSVHEREIPNVSKLLAFWTVETVSNICQRMDLIHLMIALLLFFSFILFSVWACVCETEAQFKETAFPSKKKCWQK